MLEVQLLRTPAIGQVVQYKFDNFSGRASDYRDLSCIKEDMFILCFHHEELMAPYSDAPYWSLLVTFDGYMDKEMTMDNIPTIIGLIIAAHLKKLSLAAAVSCLIEDRR